MKAKKLLYMAIFALAIVSCSKNEDSKPEENTPPVFNGRSITVKEDIDDTEVIATLTATDVDGDELAYSITTNDNNLFEIGLENGELSLAQGKSLDFEEAESHTITVSVSDGVKTVEAQVGILVENVIESLAEDPDAFIVTFKTDTDGEDITIGLNQGYTYDYTIDWGDGTVGNNASEHTYDNAGTYTVAIKGEFPVINMYQNPSATKLMSIEQWGAVVWKYFFQAFGGCNNMVYNATDAPNLTQVIVMGYMFHNASQFNGDLSNWDVGNVIYMKGMFAGATSFNGDITTWDVTSVVNMSEMFTNAESFNQDLSGWVTTNVTDMSNMFSGATSFNGDISDWKVNNVTSMSGMFEHAESFNQDIEGWNVEKVTKMNAMFNYATKFSQDLGGWNLSGVTNMEGMFDNSGLKYYDYGATLIGWSNAPTTPHNITLGAENLFTCGSEADDAKEFLTNVKGWTIEGDLGGCQT
ncbi:BspA family leucine-rich repeat surface protein [Flagellimonas nanhaiensis]|nr:BspA family leucine-rich repeat surface protein [Allomuricauda nanhaiensis]